ncbi:hypothetical protein I4U23_014744 [Adineta vaga]|nr:hypothetical protein I4U23_014744 [Adineta vaga]
MDRVFNKTVGALNRFGDSLERHFSVDGHARSKSGMMFGNNGPLYNRPLDQRNHGASLYPSKSRNLSFASMRKLPLTTLSTSTGYNGFSHFSQRPSSMHKVGNDRLDRPLYGGKSSGALNYGLHSQNDGFAGGMGDISGGMGCCPPPVVGCAPNYYIAERRQMELIPAPPPQIIHQPVPCPVPVDRPVPVPCPVACPVPCPVDRPVPVPVPCAVPVDRPVPVPVPVCVPSPPPPPVCIPVPTPVPCLVPCCCPPPCCPPPCCPSPCCPPLSCCPSPCCPSPCCLPLSSSQSPMMIDPTSSFNQRFGGGGGSGFGGGIGSTSYGATNPFGVI